MDVVHEVPADCQKAQCRQRTLIGAQRQLIGGQLLGDDVKVVINLEAAKKKN